MMSVITQKLIGITVGSHSYLPVFIFIGSAYLIAFFLVQVLIGKIGKIQELQIQ
jgi:ACS family hexuronate transporter-like MFS transporter